MNIYLFVDGSSAYKDDIGAWAAVAVMGTKRQILYGVNFPTTISRCELLPIIEGLRWIKQNWYEDGMQVIVTSDSDYTVNGRAVKLTERISVWNLEEENELWIQ